MFNCKEKLNGILTEHNVIDLSRVTDTATALRSVISTVSPWGLEKCTKMDFPL